MNSVLKLTLAFLLAFLIAGTIFALLGFGFVAAAASGSKPTIEHGSILTVDLSEPVTERGGSPSPMTLLQGGGTSTVPGYELASVLRHAATDDRVSGVLLHGGLGGSMSALTAAREALAEVRAAKKPIYAYYSSPDEKTIWFASAADETWIEPLDVVIFDGFAAEIPYFRRHAQVRHRGPGHARRQVQVGGRAVPAGPHELREPRADAGDPRRRASDVVRTDRGLEGHRRAEARRDRSPKRAG